MSTLIDSLAGKLREFIGDRRRISRRQARVYARLPFTVMLLDTMQEVAEDLTGKKSLAGQTSDISEGGLTLLLNVVRLGNSYVTDQKHYLGIKLELPSGPVAMLAVPVRFDDRAGTESEFKYLLGVRIMKIDEDAHARYLAYLRTLVVNERRVRQQTQDSVKAASALAQGAGMVNAWATVTPTHVSEAFEKFLRESAHPRKS